MARPKSDEKRAAIMAAAIRVFARDGLAAPTAMIADEAGVSNGSLFTYFETKSALLNEIYVALKTEWGEATFADLPHKSDIREQMRHVWAGWLRWAASNPDKRRTLAHLAVSDEVSAESRQAGGRAFSRVGPLLDRSRAGGSMCDAPIDLVAALMNGVAEATIDFMKRDPTNAEAHCAAAFEACWRMIA